MKKNLFTVLISVIIVSFCIVGFVISGKNDPAGSKMNTISKSQPTTHEHYITPNSIIYTDDFDGANDTTSLKLRGYKVWYRGTGPQGTTATWYQGQDAVFSAYNGPTTGYVAANYNVVTNVNLIDSWLVLPRISGGLNQGDSLYFYERSLYQDTYADSLWIMYSSSDSIPEGTWTLLARIKTNTATDAWLRVGFVAPATSVDGRFAIRYHVADGGPNGADSDYLGIDALSIVRSVTGTSHNGQDVPKDFKLAQNYPNPFNPSTNISFSVPKAGNVKISVYDVLGNEVGTVLNEYKQAGNYNVNYNASALSSGVYFYKMISGSYIETRKMTLIK